MNSATPPPLPEANSGLHTYLRTGVFLIPTLLAWAFTTLFLLPKVRQLWNDAGLMTSRVQWLMETAEFLIVPLAFIFVGGFVILLILEFWWPAWPRYRRVVFACIALFIHTVVLAGILAISTAALVAAPVLPDKKRTPLQSPQ